MNCRHCGASDTLERVLDEAIEKRSEDAWDRRYEWSQNLFVQRCKWCKELTLSTYVYSDWMNPEDVSYRTVYPEQRDLSFLPSRVKVELEKAQKVKAVDASYYALGLRRTLEAICTENGIGRKANLGERLKDLARQENLPDVFVGMAVYLRHLGNIGAHESGIDVTNADIIAATEFTDAILEFLYIAPAKLDRVSKELEDRKGETKKGSG
ncbi:DUF4145 domain-containing protein [Saccharomonospora iraqiensis]|uniref:DUF4145 domain-containing protein n=1 Tax=Saccharomonospora iraqiensis TaxID=52698 RepID=UPI000A036652|nr:DUF4145 domain-containing protein [Saccharomonospora iraqiensis]